MLANLDLPIPLRTEPAVRLAYRTDAGQIVEGVPDAVVHASAPETVAALLQWAQRERVPVTCRGGGLTTEGESVTRRGVLLDLKGMNGVLECDGGTAWVQAGTTWYQLAEALRARSLDYISAPLNLLSSVGGTLGVGGIDLNSHRHGCSADQCVEVEVVTPTGEITRAREGDDYFERVMLGYGQFGVITKARMRARRYRPMTVRNFLYADVAPAIEDMMRLVESDAVDACCVITLRDEVVALVVGDEDVPKPLDLRYTTDARFYARLGARYLPVPSRWRDLAFLFRRKKQLRPALRNPLFLRDGRIEDRAIVFSRLIWSYWGDRKIVLPDLAVTKANFVATAKAGIDVCKRFFPYFTLYCVMVRKFGDRPRYEMSAIPATKDDHVCGVEFSPLLEGREYPDAHYQAFKNAIYDVGLRFGGTCYRFGGAMKPYVRRIFGDAVVDRHRGYKLALDPAFVLNPGVVFDPPETRA